MVRVGIKKKKGEFDKNLLKIKDFNLFSFIFIVQLDYAMMFTYIFKDFLKSTVS